MTEHIRWHRRPDGGLFGVAGAVKPPLFRVHRPLGEEEFRLTSALPGQEEWLLEGDPGALKKAAEAWLEEFISSLGAVFLNDIAPLPATQSPAPRAAGTETTDA